MKSKSAIGPRVKLFYADGTRGHTYINNRPDALQVKRRRKVSDVEERETVHKFTRCGADEYREVPTPKAANRGGTL